MRIVALPADETACGNLRVSWVASMLQAEHPDWKVEIYKPGSVQGAAHSDGRLSLVKGLDLDGIDVAVMQRVGSPMMLGLQRAIQERGGAVVVDADDALWCIHKSNKAWRSWNSRNGMHWSVMDQACKEADLVTVTTPRLAARYGAHGRVEIVPNRLPAMVSELPSERDHYDEAPSFGWSGFVATHPTDLHVMGDAANRVLKDIPEAVIRIVGASHGIIEAWELEPVVAAGRVGATGGVKIEQFYQALDCIDVGVVPLDDSTFNACKSGLKAVEYAARGIPAVVTPTVAHRELIREGYPLTYAATPREWHTHVKAFLEDGNARLTVGQVARHAAERQTMENHLDRWEQAWLRAAARRTRMTA